mmetsp:Transcript_20274/g.64504  ORF Transcript_20274/g.64504 Transcript_20274/m.64504 type:complete len:619 (+) Transcript_20274:1314-3170(+)
MVVLHSAHLRGLLQEDARAARADHHVAPHVPVRVVEHEAEAREEVGLGDDARADGAPLNQEGLPGVVRVEGVSCLGVGADLDHGRAHHVELGVLEVGRGGAPHVHDLDVLGREVSAAHHDRVRAHTCRGHKVGADRRRAGHHANPLVHVRVRERRGERNGRPTDGGDCDILSLSWDGIPARPNGHVFEVPVADVAAHNGVGKDEDVPRLPALAGAGRGESGGPLGHARGEGAVEAARPPLELHVSSEGDQAEELTEGILGGGHGRGEGDGRPGGGVRLRGRGHVERPPFHEEDRARVELHRGRSREQHLTQDTEAAQARGRCCVEGDPNAVRNKGAVPGRDPCLQGDVRIRAGAADDDIGSSVEEGHPLLAGGVVGPVHSRGVEVPVLLPVEPGRGDHLPRRPAPAGRHPRGAARRRLHCDLGRARGPGHTGHGNRRHKLVGAGGCEGHGGLERRCIGEHRPRGGRAPRQRRALPQVPWGRLGGEGGGAERVVDAAAAARAEGQGSGNGNEGRVGLVGHCHRLGNRVLAVARRHNDLILPRRSPRAKQEVRRRGRSIRKRHACGRPCHCPGDRHGAAGRQAIVGDGCRDRDEAPARGRVGSFGEHNARREVGGGRGDV